MLWWPWCGCPVCTGVEERSWVPDLPPNPPNYHRSSAGNVLPAGEGRLYPSCLTGTTKSGAPLKKPWPTGLEKTISLAQVIPEGNCISNVQRKEVFLKTLGRAAPKLCLCLELGLGCVGPARILQCCSTCRVPLRSWEQWPRFSNFCILQLPARAEREPAPAKSDLKLCRAGTHCQWLQDRDLLSLSDHALNNSGAFCWTCGLPLCKEKQLAFARRTDLFCCCFLSKHFLWCKCEYWQVCLRVWELTLGWDGALVFNVQWMHIAWMDALIIFLLPLLW